MLAPSLLLDDAANDPWCREALGLTRVTSKKGAKRCIVGLAPRQFIVREDFRLRKPYSAGQLHKKMITGKSEARVSYHGWKGRDWHHMKGSFNLCAASLSRLDENNMNNAIQLGEKKTIRVNSNKSQTLQVRSFGDDSLFGASLTWTSLREVVTKFIQIYG